MPAKIFQKKGQITKVTMEYLSLSFQIQKNLSS